MSFELEIAVDAARRGGEIVARYYRDGVEIRTKEAFNLVSDADVESEQIIAETIRAAFPGHVILGEELHSGDAQAEHAWIVDPLDGTNNFAHQVPQFAVSIAYCHHGRPMAGVVFNPVRDEWYTAARGHGAFFNGKPIHVSSHERLDQTLVGVGFYYDRGKLMERTLEAIGDLFRRQIHGIRRFGAAALDLCSVASGRFGAFFEYQLSPWDYAAGILIVEEAGGVVSDCVGNPLTMTQGSILATNGRLHTAMVEVVGPHYLAATP